MNTLTGAIVLFFAAMGLLALAAPERVSTIFGVRTLTAAGRNEIRAVYGGFGLAVAVLLVASWESPAFRPGVFVAVSVSLAGMAGGRLIAALIERPEQFYPSWFFCLVEGSMAAILWWAAWRLV